LDLDEDVVAEEPAHLDERAPGGCSVFTYSSRIARSDPNGRGSVSGERKRRSGAATRRC
jgi:hypothetical protein